MRVGLSTPKASPLSSALRGNANLFACSAPALLTHYPLQHSRILQARMLCGNVEATPPAVPGVFYSEEGVPCDEAGAPLSKTAFKKLQKAAAVAARKAQKKAEKQAAAAAAGGTAAATPDSANEGAETVEPDAPYMFTDAGILMSDASPELQRRVYSSIRDLGSAEGVASGQEVWLRGRLSVLRAGTNNCFIVLRAQGQYTVQAVFFRDKETPRQSREMLSKLGALTEESIIDVRGTLVEATVNGCSQANVEVQIKEVVLVSASEPKLPFEIADAARSEEEIIASEGSERPFPRIGQVRSATD
jgi:hypothetical protein